MIKVNQIYKHKKTSDYQVEIIGKSRRDKWKARILTNKPGVYNGSHTLSAFTIKRQFELVE